MPSASGNEIIASMTKFLGRKPSKNEVVACEELALNVAPGAVLSYIRSTEKRYANKPRILNHVYSPICQGVLKGAYRMPKWTRLNGAIYWHMHGFLGDGFSSKELVDVAWISTLNATAEELDSAIKTASNRNIFSSAYVKAIIVGRRNVVKRQADYERAKFKKVEDGPPVIVAESDHVGDSWTKRIGGAVSHAEEQVIVERAKEKMRVR
jgi:hypothetical protein